MIINSESLKYKKWYETRFSPPVAIEVNNGIRAETRTLDLSDMQGGELRDMLNTLDVDEERQLLVSGSEKGKVFLVDFGRNKVRNVYESDNWLSSTLICRESIVVAGCKRRIEVFPFRGSHVAFRVQANPEFEAYYNRGIIALRRDRRCNVVANTGYASFTLMQAHTRKVILRLKIPSACLSGARRAYDVNHKPVVQNFVLMEDSSLLCFLCAEDPHLYIYDYSRMILIYKLKLFDAETLSTNKFLSNNILISSKDVLVTVLQFSMNKRGPKNIKSVLFVHRIIREKRKPVGFEFLFSLLHTDLEIIMCSDITHQPHIQVEGVESPVLLLLGGSSGVTRTLIIDLKNKRSFEPSKIQKSSMCTILLPRRRGFCREVLPQRVRLRDLRREYTHVPEDIPREDPTGEELI